MPTPFKLNAGTVDGGGFYLRYGSFFQPRSLYNESLKFRFYWGTSSDGTQWAFDLFYPEGKREYYTAYTFFPSGNPINNRFGTVGTLRIIVYKESQFGDNSKSYIKTTRFDNTVELFQHDQALQAYDQLQLGIIEDDTQGTTPNWTDTNVLINLPTLGTEGTTFLWIDSDGKTYSDSAYATIACGSLAKRSFSDTVTFTETNPKLPRKSFNDYAEFTENFKWNPRRYPVEIITFADYLALTSLRHGTITNWTFQPNYKILFEENGDGSFATTNWAERIKSFSTIEKQLKHWTGDLQVGNWSPSFVDESQELWGSLFGNGAEPRGKQLRVSAMINTNPLTYVNQFTGAIDSIQVKDGIINFQLKDLLKDLPNRQFVYDYANLGSQAYGRKWGIVLKVYGTDVMFDDYGDVEWIQRKKKGRTFLESLGISLLTAGVSAITGGWAGAAIGAAGGVLSNRPQNDRVIGAYYKIQDYDKIPDDLVSSGQRVKFYSGSISGVATNLNNPLTKQKEYIITGGTLRFGIFGTFSFSDTKDIKVGDYLYIAQPVSMKGSPNQIIRALLTGSNIDYPYLNDKILDGKRKSDKDFRGNWLPSITLGTIPGDFNSNWDSELELADLIEISKTILQNDNSTPFDELKEIASDLQLSFYISEENKFSIKSIRPRQLLFATTSATYSEDQQIKSGFSFSRGNTEAYAGIRIWYDYQGEGIGINQGYSKLLEVKFPNSVARVTQFKEIKSKWLRNDIDAKTIAWRFQTHTELGVDSISIPTTLYGLINNITDTIRVSHTTGSLTNRLFEIIGYRKAFENSTVDLEAIDVQRTYGRGNCKWASAIQESGTLPSGVSRIGYATTLNSIGSINGTLGIFSSDDFQVKDYTAVKIFNGLTVRNYAGHYIGFGSKVGTNPSMNYMEICELLGVYTTFGIFDGVSHVAVFKRGLFDTIPRPYFPNESFYDLGPIQRDQFGSYVGTVLYCYLGTSYDINSSILGTAYKFF